VNDSWAPLSPVSDLVNDKLLFGSLQFTVSWIENALLEFDSSKGLAGPRRYSTADSETLYFQICISSLHALQQVINNVYLPR
jgi:hypothetical protein